MKKMVTITKCQRKDLLPGDFYYSEPITLRMTDRGIAIGCGAVLHILLEPSAAELDVFKIVVKNAPALRNGEMIDVDDAGRLVEADEVRVDSILSEARSKAEKAGIS